MNTFSIPKATIEMKWGEPVCLIGSCFSDELAPHFQQNGFSCYSNPFGTLFHPEAIANFIDFILSDNAEIPIYQRGDLFFSWLASGTIFAYSKEELSSKIERIKSDFLLQLTQSKWLIFTLGTAWGYRLKESCLLVANCHKASSSLFDKELTEMETMKHKWIDILAKIKQINPNVQFIFTVSPVRHIRDGWWENNRSKGRLHELIFQLSQTISLSYFPSYELVVDHLRDYRFFKEDGVHPNELAIKTVWNRFKETYFSEELQAFIQTYSHLRQRCFHRSLYAESMETKRFNQATFEQLKQFLDQHASIFLDDQIKTWKSENANDRLNK